MGRASDIELGPLAFVAVTKPFMSLKAAPVPGVETVTVRVQRQHTAAFLEEK